MSQSTCCTKSPAVILLLLILARNMPAGAHASDSIDLREVKYTESAECTAAKEKLRRAGKKVPSDCGEAIYEAGRLEQDVPKPPEPPPEPPPRPQQPVMELLLVPAVEVSQTKQDVPQERPKPKARQEHTLKRNTPKLPARLPVSVGDFDSLHNGFSKDYIVPQTAKSTQSEEGYDGIEELIALSQIGAKPLEGNSATIAQEDSPNVHGGRSSAAARLDEGNSEEAIGPSPRPTTSSPDAIWKNKDALLDAIHDVGNPNVTRSKAVDVYVWDPDILALSVGHVMVTDSNSRHVLLSPFPIESSPWNLNVPLGFEETMGKESRNPDYKFRVTVEENGFQAVAQDHASRTWWVCLPVADDQTQCARAAYDALRAGRVPLPGLGALPFGPGSMPRTLAQNLKNLSASPNSGIEVLVEPPPPKPPLYFGNQ